VVFGLADECLVNSIEHQLGAADPLEVPYAVDVAPCEVQEAIAALAVDWRTAEVQRPVGCGDDADVELPASAGRVAGDQLAWFSSDLDTDMDVVEAIAVGTAERPTRKIEPLDDNSHAVSVA
jgi:hypothetical protein